MKIPATTAIMIHLRLIKTRMYSRSVDSCDGNTLYSAELIDLINSACSPEGSSRNPSLARGTLLLGSLPRGSLPRGSLLRGTRGPDDIVTPSPLQGGCDRAPHPTHRFRSRLASTQQAGSTKTGCQEEFA